MPVTAVGHQMSEAPGHWHSPSVQTSPSAHRYPHSLQLALSVIRFLQVLPHRVVPPEHVMHDPLLQTWSSPQVFLQLPQFARSPEVSAQELPQTVVPKVQTLQAPSSQTAGEGQVFPQTPQLFRSRLRYTQVPLHSVVP
jgi:hypothetical protein